MTQNQTTDELLLYEIVSSHEVDKAVDAYLGSLAAKHFHFQAGYWLDIHKAVTSHPFANATISGGGAKPARKRGVVRTAILLACPEKA
ncbi:hypothetical protein [Methylobacterium goesingense]|nr:hypothetical protein [Methylobacterium goesingense]